MVFQVSRYPICYQKNREIAPERMRRLSQSGKDMQLWMCLVVKLKSDAIKNNIAEERGMVGS